MQSSWKLAAGICLKLAAGICLMFTIAGGFTVVAQEAPARLTLEFDHKRFKADANVGFSLRLTNISTRPFYVRRRIDVKNSDPLIGQFSVEVREKGSPLFVELFSSFADYGPGAGARVLPTDEELVRKNEIVLLGPGQFIGQSFQDSWANLLPLPSVIHPQELRVPGRYVLRAKYTPWRESFGTPSMILDKVIVSNDLAACRT